MNRIKTVLLLGLMTGLIVFIGGMIGGRSGMIIALVLAGVMNFASYWYSDSIVLKAYGARPLERSQAPELFDLVAELARSAELPMPRVAVVNDPTPNAFATGRDPQHAVVAVTTGIMDTLSRRELRGVLAHELGHVQDRDILVSSVAATLAGAVMVLANLAQWGAIFGMGRGDDDEGGGGLGLILVAILAPIGALLIQMGISRSREYLADREGAEISGDPEALASALAKLEAANQRRPLAHAKPANAHLCIVNPLKGGGVAGLFSTHPPIPERIGRLKEIARAMGPQASAARASAAGIKGPVATPPPPPPPPSPASRPPQGGGGGIDWS